MTSTVRRMPPFPLLLLLGVSFAMKSALAFTPAIPMHQVSSTVLQAPLFSRSITAAFRSPILRKPCGIPRMAEVSDTVGASVSTVEKQTLSADESKKIPSHSSDKHAFCHAGVCNFHEDEFELGPEADTEDDVLPADSPGLVARLMKGAENMSERTATMWILGVVAISGVNFGVVKQVSEVFDSPSLLFGRFLVASLCLIPWLLNTPKKVLRGGLESGAWLGAGYIAQAVSLAGGTPSSICSFFASLSCIICPFIEQFLGVRLDRKAWAAAALAIAGAGVLELGGGTLPTQHDLIALLQPVLFGIYLIRTEDTMKNHPKEAMSITALQMVATTTIAASWGAAQASAVSSLDLTHAVAWLQTFASHPVESLELVYMGVGPSALALAIETVALAKLSSSKTALLFSTEPLFAAAFGALFLGEHIGANVLVGGLLATTACLVRSLTLEDVKRALSGVGRPTEKEA